MTSQDLQARMGRWGARLGLPGGVGVALLALAVWGEWVDTPAKLAQAAELNAEAARVRQAKPGELPREERPQAMLNDLYARLPSPSQRSAALSTLLKRAGSDHLSVESVQFRAEIDRPTGLLRHEINLPLKGNYAAVRAWVEHALQDQPALALEAIELKREQPQADPVEARVKASLWLRPTAGGTTTPARAASAAASASAASRRGPA